MRYIIILASLFSASALANEFRLGLSPNVFLNSMRSIYTDNVGAAAGVEVDLSTEYSLEARVDYFSTEQGNFRNRILSMGILPGKQIWANEEDEALIKVGLSLDYYRQQELITGKEHIASEDLLVSLHLGPMLNHKLADKQKLSLHPQLVLQQFKASASYLNLGVFYTWEL